MSGPASRLAVHGVIPASVTPEQRAAAGWPAWAPPGRQRRI